MAGQVHAWHPEVPSLREVYYARFDHAYPMHTHDDWAVMLVDDGAVAYDLGRADHHATPAAVTVLPPGVPHDGRSADGTSYRKRVLYFEPGWLPERMSGAVVGQPTLAAAGPLGAVRRLHAALCDPGDLMAAEHWALAVRHQVLTHLGTPASTTRDAPLARRLRDLLDDRFTGSVTIAAAADRLGTHPSHLVRVFSQTYGITPHRYVVGRRIDLARRLLVDGHAPAQVAAIAGFHDQAHLTRHFRRVLGTTPAAFVA